MDERIAEAIKNVIDEGTFTPAALKRMNEALEKVKTLERKSAQDEHKISELQRAVTRLELDVNECERKLTRFREREENLRQAEDENATLVREKAVAQARAETYAICFSAVFRNTEIRRKIHHSNAVPMADQYGSIVQYGTNHTEDTVEQAD